MKINLRILLAACLPLMLAACAPQLVRTKGDTATLAQQQLREQQLVGVDRWTLQGRLALSNGRDGGSVNLTWTQDGQHYEFMVTAPTKSFRLSGDQHGALLEGADGGPLRGASAEALMQHALGWDIPLDELRAWVLGVRASGSSADVSFGADKLLSQIDQDGWAVSYPAWDTSRQPALPIKVFAEKPPYKVKLVIESWVLQ